MRTLVYFPIIHSFQEMSSLGDAASQLRTEEQAQKQAATDGRFWGMVAAAIENLGLDYTRLKIYLDGLPLRGKEIEIVADVAAASGGKNHPLLETLHHKGATLMGTESPELLLQEYALMLMAQYLQTGEASGPTMETAEALLAQRDNCIAQRIDGTLQEEEIAMLFLEFAHNIEAKLPKDIILIQPLGKKSVGMGSSV